ncbi:MAG: thioredoxin domain-containing protein [Candidatus Micrarchaeota archaeon]|nr:thioredoxin domain-containing protein [Candidatus Micrarchaeota archaeon]
MNVSRGLVLALLVALTLLLAGCASAPKINQGVDAQGQYYRGASNATVTIYEYTDFECPNCKLAEPEIANFLARYQDRGVRVVFKNFPLESIHPDARGAAVAAVCAGRQGQFWEYHDLLFASQPYLSAQNLMDYATRLKLDTVQFATCLKDPSAQAQVDADEAQGFGLGLQGTPTFIAGDIKLIGVQSADRLGQAADKMLASAGQ